MPKRFQASSSLCKGSTFKIQRAQGCAWCKLGVRPQSPGICDACVKQFKRLLSSTRWRKLRRLVLSEVPFCVHCQARGVHNAIVVAEEVDHIQPWRTFPDLFWERSNLQGLCEICHKHKTNTEDGGGFRKSKSNR